MNGYTAYQWSIFVSSSFDLLAFRNCNSNVIFFITMSMVGGVPCLKRLFTCRVTYYSTVKGRGIIHVIGLWAYVDHCAGRVG
jgi:hypothetical protein